MRLPNLFCQARLLSSLLLILNLVSPAAAKYAHVETEEVPVQRLLTNLETRAHAFGLSDQDKASLEYQIGRLHSMAYAQKTEIAQIRKPKEGVTDDSAPVPYYGFGPSAQRQFDVSAATDKAMENAAKEHLNQAISHLRKSLSLDPSSLTAKLGLGWCLDQRGDKAQALTLYREAFNAGWQSESQFGSGLKGGSIASETAGYLTKLLDPQKDAAELSDIEAKRSKLRTVFRAMTPIVVPLVPNVASSSMMAPATVKFDLDGTGLRTYSSWPDAGKAAWLVYDAKNRGDIRSGLQLFGDKTFWIFWKDGYEALSALDDNADGRLEGAELNGLSLWEDLNHDGLSQPGEVKPLAHYGIKSLSCASVKSTNGMPFSKSGVVFENGSSADSYDWILRGK
jgi:tetratricopeptide (TPR) repeat protein